MKISTNFLLLACTYIFISSAINAQTATNLQKVYGAGTAEFRNMKATKDGGFIMCASAYGQSTDKTEVGYGSYDYWVVKTNKLGKIQWNRTLGASGVEYCSSIIQTRDGGYLVGGTSNESVSATKTSPGYGSDDYWVVKLDKFGNIEWDKSLGSAGTEMTVSVDTTLDGGYIIGGSSPEGATGVKTNSGYGGYDYWIVKLDANGNKIWDNTFGGSNDDYASQVKHTADGGYIIGGSSMSSTISGVKTEKGRGDQDYWIVKIDDSGNKVWDKTMGGSGFDNLYSIIATPDGGCIGGGQTESPVSGDKTAVGKGGTDFWLVKLNANGVPVWNKTLGGNDYEDLGFLINTKDGGFAIAGTSMSAISGDKSEPSYESHDYWAVKCDASGNKLWDKTFGGTYPDDCFAIVELSSDMYVIGGQSLSGISGNRTVDHKGFFDSWIVGFKTPATTDAASAVATNNVKNKNTIIYCLPKPCKRCSACTD